MDSGLTLLMGLQIRAVLKHKYGASALQAFENLDLDGDGKLSQRDIVEGLKKVCSRVAIGNPPAVLGIVLFAVIDTSKPALYIYTYTFIYILVTVRAPAESEVRISAQAGLELSAEEAGALIASGDFDMDQAIDYYEFLVRFGLEQQIAGKWVFQVNAAYIGIFWGQTAHGRRRR